ncbi:MAG: hypothetical protein GY941_26545, partial [Planctomycetes bacterium]|nr:hypothetical protein [Planctomycetota bacterium]
RYIWNTIPEFVEMAVEGDLRSLEYRQFIETNFSLEIQLEKVDRIISEAFRGNDTESQSVETVHVENVHTLEK